MVVEAMKLSPLLSAVLALLVAHPAAAIEAKLTVRETAGVARSGGIVNCGVPFAKGAVKDLSRLSVSVDGKPVAAQFKVLAPWDDGSVRWAMVTFAADVPSKGTAAVVIGDDGRNAATKQSARADAGPDGVRVSTGPLRFTINRKAGPLLQSVESDGKPLLGAKGAAIVLYTAAGEPVAAGAPADVTVDEAGPVRVVVTARGIFPGVHNGLLGYTARFTATAGGKAIKRLYNLILVPVIHFLIPSGSTQF